MFNRFLFVFLFVCLLYVTSYGQEQPDTTTAVSTINVDLLNIFNQKIPIKYKIVSIHVKGSTSFDENLLVAISNLTEGQVVTIPGTDAFSKAMESIWKQNYFSNVEIYITNLTKNNEISIEIDVAERPRLGSFVIKGVGKGDQEDLIPKLGLIKNRVITGNLVNNATVVIKKFYLDKSYQGTSVKIVEQKDTTLKNHDNLVIYINKGNKLKVSNIDIFGNVNITDQQIKKQMKGTHELSRLTLFAPRDNKGNIIPPQYTFKEYVAEQGYLIPTKTLRVLDPYFRFHVFASAKFKPEKYDEDKEKIIQYYNSLGYRDARIVKDSLYTNNKGNLNIDIRLKEGDKYYFGNITWRGNTKYSDSVLNLILNIHKGDVYNINILNNRLGKTLSADGGEDISSLYTDDGYLFFQANPVEVSVYNDTIDYEIRIIEGPQAYYRNINIVGNDKTKDYVIRRELRTIPGEKFSRQEVIRSQRELSQLSFFNAEKITPQINPNVEDGTVDITWQVEEKSSDQLELSAGWGGGIGLTGTVGITLNNFSLRGILDPKSWRPLPSGSGQKLSFRIQSNGPSFQSYNVSFTEPWLGGKKRNAFTVSFYDTRYAGGVNTPNYTTLIPVASSNSYIRTTGLSVALGKQLKWPDDFFNVTFSVNYIRYKLRNYAIDQVNLPNFSNGFSNNFNFKIALSRNSLDQAIFPRSGSNFLLSLELTPPYSIIDPNFLSTSNPYYFIEYHKWRFNGDWYFPLGRARGADKNRQFVLRASVKYGYIGRYNLNLQVSPFGRFQVGDAGISNQFALLGYDIISQRGYPVYQSSDPKVNPEQTTATSFFTIFNKYTLELRYPLSLNPSATIYALTFMEAANGWYSLQTYNPFQLRRSVGIGFRFFLPAFGLLGFDYGIGLDRFTPTSTLSSVGRFTFMLGYEPE